MSRITYAATSLFACLATVALAAPANARHLHHHTSSHTTHVAQYTGGHRHIAYRSRHRATVARRTRVAASGSGTILGGRPAGCPHTYCGCGVSLKVFGKIRPELNLAWNWARYFQHEPVARVGLVAVRHGHVMQIVGGGEGRWVVYDPNSGGGLTREHVRDLRGYVFVNPHATKMASR